MDTLLNDVRYAFRQLIANRSMSVIAILTLALGIGANVSVMSLVNATLFKPAVAEKPHELVWVTPRWERGGRYASWSYPNYKDFAASAQSYAGVLVFANMRLSLGGDSPQRIEALAVSGNYFDLLGTRMPLGRALHPTDDMTTATELVVVLSHGLWTARFGGDSSVLGKQIILNAHQFTVVGVAPKGLAGISLGDLASAWIPVSAARLFSDYVGLYTQPNAGWLTAVARLKPSVSPGQAQGEATVLAPRLQSEGTPPDERRTLVVRPVSGGLDPSNREQAAPILALVMVVPLLVLTVACANVANLFVARSVRRRKELAVRRALGASRGRLVRQLMTESVMLAAVASVVGMLMSSWLTAILSRVAAIPSDIAPALTPDARVFGATFVLAIAAGALFGLLPSLAATHEALTPALKNEGLTLRIGRTHHRLRNAFVVGQVAVSLLLLITAGLFVGSLTKALNVEPGFDPRNAVSVGFDLRAQGYDSAKIELFNRALLERVLVTPGIESAALANVIPLSNRAMGNSIEREGAGGDNINVGSQLSAVSADFFATLRIPFVRGRAFTAQEQAGNAPVIVINETLARRFWTDADPIGKRVRVGGNGPWREVIGVVRDGKWKSLAEAQPFPYFVVPATSDDLGGDVTLVVRGMGDTKATIGAVTEVFRSLDPNLPLFRVATLDQNVANTVDGQRAGAALLGVFGALALSLAALGIFAVISQGVATRTREIGIRMSLGAQAVDVVGAFVREGLSLTLIGGLIGVGLSVAISRLLVTLLFGLTPTDVLTFVYACGILGLVALVASVVPARRAARVDPMVALRSE